MELLSPSRGNVVRHLVPPQWHIGLSDAFLQGHMGWAVVPSEGDRSSRGRGPDVPGLPVSSVITVGDFMMLWGREDDDLLARAFEEARRRRLPGLQVIPSAPGWRQAVLRVWGTDGLRPYTRTVFDPRLLDTEAFSRFESLVAERRYPDAFSLRSMDTDLAERIAELSWCCDGVVNFDSPGDAAGRSIAFVALLEERTVALSGCYTVYDGGIEIEIDTHPDYRRQGFASAAVAAQIRHCLDHGIVPHWDAYDAVSAAFARKLGFRGGTDYECLELSAP